MIYLFRRVCHINFVSFLVLSFDKWMQPNLHCGDAILYCAAEMKNIDFVNNVEVAMFI